jgi:SMODS and SLOG-associating 2TM effector domain family 5
MKASDTQYPSMLRLVASAEQAVGERTAPPVRGSHLQLVTDDQPRAQLLNTMTLVAAARRQAIRRIRHKLFLRQMTVVCLLTVLAGILAALSLQAADIGSGFNRQLSVVGLVTAVAALLMAGCHDHERAVLVIRALAVCVADIEALQRELRIASTCAPGVVQDVRQRYGDTLRRCPATHVHADYLVARLAPAAPWRMHMRARLRYALRVYLPDGLVLATPLLLLFALN